MTNKNNTENQFENVCCINCGKGVKELYKKYSSSVLKMAECVS